ncbi:11011_t:CDS:2 [Ambispora gerdemannii]|uniref:11011_t:CDS:1 n=1 Tax=Ambispora gerdemannii TaxID=144530 RepID=A0A9N9DB97_9GLOM|nr:11011_t:CDS:2 [Ambispora gerdemannii]
MANQSQQQSLQPSLSQSFPLLQSHSEPENFFSPKQQFLQSSNVSETLFSRNAASGQELSGIINQNKLENFHAEFLRFLEA